MREFDRLVIDAGPEIHREDVGEFPLPVAGDWDDLVARSNRMSEVIDNHLDFESKLQGRELRPITLCLEQKISLASDLAAV
ncbi:MAG: hypothetical protein N3B12_00760 [Armatimonadetes bacterium]|nr:hypothetical protein [Armatimonadota bacterium]